MPWWSWRPGSAGGDEPETGGEVALQSSVRVGVPTQREPGHSSMSSADLSSIDEPDHVAPVDPGRHDHHGIVAHLTPQQARRRT